MLPALSQSTRRVIPILVGAFVVLHAGATLLRGAPPALRDPLWPAFSWYGDALRMTTTFGMFSGKNNDIAVAVHGVDKRGRRKLLAHSNQRERDLWQRIVDVRLRKFQRYLIEEGDRNAFGKQYLQYFCREAKRPELLKKVELELVHPPRAGKPPEVVLSVRCKVPRR